MIKKIIVIILFCAPALWSNAQTTGTIDSTKMVGFAKFLYDQKLYDLSAQEYERLTYHYPTERKFLLALFKCYRQLNQFDKIENKARHIEIENEDIIKEYLLSLALNDQIEIARLVYDDKKTLLNPSIASRMDLDLYVLQGNYGEAENKYQLLSLKESGYYQLIMDGKNQKYKSPLAAGIMSSVIPGLGRAYSKDYKDGIISLLFIATTSYQAYSRFSKKGTKTVGGWIYGGLSLGFYIGNIYGSVKSAKNYNKKLKSKMNEKAKAYINTFYSL